MLRSLKNELAILTTGVLLVTAWIAIAGWVTAAASGPDADPIVQKSARVTEEDRQASYNYDFSETDVESGKTYRVHMLFGSPYSELVAVNGKPLTQDQSEAEKQKLGEEVSKRKKESSEERAHRIEAFQKEQKRDGRFIEEFVHAFDFQSKGETQIGGYRAYLIDANPKAGYRATDDASQVLTGMRGRLWIDKQTYQWIKVEAYVTHPVSIEGFLAKVEPGTRFELEKTPVESDIWLPKHFSMSSDARILSLIPHRHREEEKYFDYRKSAQP